MRKWKVRRFSSNLTRDQADTALPAAAGAALAHKLAGTEEVKVFAFEGEGGLSTGVTLETLNSAWGLGLGNLVYYIDWNDYGIDSRPFSSIVNSTPKELLKQADGM